MPANALNGNAPATARHLLLYDGVCGLCNGLVQAVLAGDRGRLFDFAALQSPAARAALDRFGSNPDDLNTLHVVVGYRGDGATQLTKGRAALFVMTALGWPWRAAGLLRILPNPLLDALYDLVARSRYRIFGRYERCIPPRPEYRGRFIDAGEARPAAGRSTA